MRAHKLDLPLEFSSNNLLNIDDGLVGTKFFLNGDEIINKFKINDDGHNDDECSSDNNEDDEVQVIKTMKTSKNDAIGTLKTYIVFGNKH